MRKKTTKTELEIIQQHIEIESLKEHFNRSRSISVGTAFGGTTEITMRGNGNKFLFALLQPVEVAELIHQLSANIGCHLLLKPRDDFASWREWRISESEKKHLNGFPPFANDMAPFNSLGTSNFDQQKAENFILQNLNQTPSESVIKEETKLVKKTNNKRKTRELE